MKDWKLEVVNGHGDSTLEGVGSFREIMNQLNYSVSGALQKGWTITSVIPREEEIYGYNSIQMELSKTVEFDSTVLVSFNTSRV